MLLWAKIKIGIEMELIDPLYYAAHNTTNIFIFYSINYTHDMDMIQICKSVQSQQQSICWTSIFNIVFTVVPVLSFHL